MRSRVAARRHYAPCHADRLVDAAVHVVACLRRRQRHAVVITSRFIPHSPRKETGEDIYRRGRVYTTREASQHIIRSTAYIQDNTGQAEEEEE